MYGTKLRESGRPLKYRFNSFASTVVQLAACVVGTFVYGADFVVWTFIDRHYLQLLSTNIMFAFAISAVVYINSFTVRSGNEEMRELAQGGRTGSIMYDFFLGRELNPRFTLPFFGEIDLKSWIEMRPGLTGWALLDLAYVAKQYRNYGLLSNSIVFVSVVQVYYVLEGQYAETGLLGMMDITTDGVGFMLTFGSLVWVPFLYSTQCRYLSIHPVHLGWTGIGAVGVAFTVGVFIFRSANNQKALFRSSPDDPEVARMSYIQTKRGTRLLTSGWWGMARHINYFGDWLQASPFCLPTGLAGYVMVPAGSAAVNAMTGNYTMADGRGVTQGRAQGWAMVYTYFYALYFAILLIHRERRDDVACGAKYGEDWEKYKKQVPWRILPGVY
ncbi:erg24, C-14 sterol reductase [Metarhizium rileyi]|uniref:Delta(14)-sterol reductase n=1 Tax=Metarhizium rileyi (strain RCEF 4871) TaxID=1649241 RepID=A0A5C6G2I4_METRR|nr:erg24, C-14 sterol reductase [Metarhizium rileyi]